MENLTFYTPSSEQYDKYNEIQNLSDDKWELECVSCNDCSICHMAIHQFLLSCEKHVCVRNMTKEQFEIAMSNADIEF